MASPQLDTVSSPGSSPHAKVEPPTGNEPSHVSARTGPKQPGKWRRWLLLALVLAAGVAGYLGWKALQPAKLPDGFAKSNGRLEATEIDIATKLGGRLKELGAKEGDYVTAGQVLARMDTDTLAAQLREAEADFKKTMKSVDAATSTVAQRESEKAAAEAVVLQQAAQLERAKTHLARSEAGFARNAVSSDDLESDRANFYSTNATYNSAKAVVAATTAAISTAKSLVIEAEAAVLAAQARIQRIQADIDDSTLKAPRNGRVQYRVAQVGEVLAAGGKVLNMVDLDDVYMTFFLPTGWAGHVQLGAEVRLVLDAGPQFVIPAKVTFVEDQAQFTPKTVETAEERQKLTFRVKAHIDVELLRRNTRIVKTGLPGVAYVQLDPQAVWPAKLEVKLPE